MSILINLSLLTILSLQVSPNIPVIIKEFNYLQELPG